MKLPDWHRPSTRCWIGWKPLFEREKQFTSDASHELRTPISVILSQADFALANPGDPQETLRALQAIQSQGKKMSALVAQLLELTRADNQTLRLEKEPIDLATLCETVAEELAERADKRGISIECLLQPEVMLEGDQTLLTRMMMNLVSNAISYGKEYGHIWIRLIQKDTGIRLSIEDDGIGIAPEHINRIFDRFLPCRSLPAAVRRDGSGRAGPCNGALDRASARRHDPGGKRAGQGQRFLGDISNINTTPSDGTPQKARRPLLLRSFLPVSRQARNQAHPAPRCLRSDKARYSRTLCR